MKPNKIMLPTALAVASLSSCTVVRQGEVGVKRTLGRISEKPLSEGPRGFNPLVTTIINVPTRTSNMEVRVPLPNAKVIITNGETPLMMSPTTAQD